MTLKLYDSATRSLRDFEPLTPGKASIYICGLTVQGSPHIGHVRFAVAFDQVRRWLTAGHGLDVTLIRNVTDIEDKILTKSKRAKSTWWAWAYKHELETSQALRTLGVLPPTYEPRATGHIQEIIEMISRLIERGHAYQAEDGSGDVYFSVTSWDEYGSLTRQKIEDLAPAGDGKPGVKRDPRDFALWKGRSRSDHDDASWDSPFGTGRPGWHIECSAMAYRYFGESFDIHGGGVDLRFPHHENEIAQSQACGYGFARYWMHNAWVTMSGEKMSKSLGNTVVVSEMVKTTRPLVLRYYLGSAQYRSTIAYSPEALAEAETTINRLETFLRRVQPHLPEADQAAALAEPNFPEKFAACMDDDFNIPGALAVIFDTVRAGNSALDNNDEAGAKAAALDVLVMTEVLGVNPLSEQWAQSAAHSSATDHKELALDQIIEGRLAARAEARAAKDFATSDAIRDELAQAGIVIEDTPQGARWRVGSN